MGRSSFPELDPVYDIMVAATLPKSVLWLLGVAKEAKRLLLLGTWLLRVVTG